MALSEQSKKLWENVKANHARLRGCEGPHAWVPDPDDAFHSAEALKDRKCTKCGGTMALLDASRYDVGVTHGRRVAARDEDQVTALLQEVAKLDREDLRRAFALAKQARELLAERDGETTP